MKESLGRMLFTCFITSVVAIILVLTLDLSRTAKLVPLAAAVPTIVLLLTAVGRDLGSGLGGNPRLPTEDRQVGTGGIGEGCLPRRDSSAGRLTGRSQARREIAEIGWLAVLPLLVYLFGFIFAIPVYFVLFVKTHSSRAWPVALWLSGAIGLLLYVVLSLFLRADLFGGQLWTWLAR